MAAAHLPIITGAAARCLAAALAFTCLTCGPRAAPGPAAEVSPAASAAAGAAPGANRGVILVVGTSLTAGYGLPDPDDAYPALLQERIDAAGLPYRVVNAGVSGETSAGARRRIDWLFRQKVAVLVLETGANDALRGQDPAATRDNIDAILARASAQSPPPRLVLLGMKAPPNFGARYTTRFDSIYADLAREHDAVLVPFLLEGVAGVPALNQADGIHPTPEGQKRMAELVWGALAPLLAAEKAD